MKNKIKAAILITVMFGIPLAIAVINQRWPEVIAILKG